MAVPWWLRSVAGMVPMSDLTAEEIAGIGHGLSEWLDDAAPLNERRFVFAAEGSVARRVNPIIAAREAAAHAAGVAEGRAQVAAKVEALVPTVAAHYPHLFQCSCRTPIKTRALPDKGEREMAWAAHLADVLLAEVRGGGDPT